MMWVSQSSRRLNNTATWLAVCGLLLQSITPWAYAHEGMMDGATGMACESHHQAHAESHAPTHPLGSDDHGHHQPSPSTDADSRLNDHLVCERACALSPMAVASVAWVVAKPRLHVRALLKVPDLPSHSSDLFKPPPIA